MRSEQKMVRCNAICAVTSSAVAPVSKGFEIETLNLVSSFFTTVRKDVIGHL